jgi:broad specificity phosphatase PhoE
VVVVTSGGVISAVCAGLLGLDDAAWAGLNRVIVNTAITKLVHGRSGTTLLSVNDHAHLETQPKDFLTYR